MWGPIVKSETGIMRFWSCNFYGDDGDILIVQNWRAPAFFHHIDVPSYDMGWITNILGHIRNSDVCDGFPASGYPCSDEIACELAAAGRCMIEQVLGESMDDQWVDVDVRPSHPLCAPSSEPPFDIDAARVRVMDMLSRGADGTQDNAIGYRTDMHMADIEVALRMASERKR